MDEDDLGDLWRSY